MHVATLRAKYAALVPVLTERSRRVWAATEARAIGYGGIAAVARATGIAESTIQRGLRDLDAREPLPLAKIHEAILFEFLPGRDDAVLFGAQAVKTMAALAKGEPYKGDAVRYVPYRIITKDGDNGTLPVGPFRTDLLKILRSAR